MAVVIVGVLASRCFRSNLAGRNVVAAVGTQSPFLVQIDSPHDHCLGSRASSLLCVHNFLFLSIPVVIALQVSYTGLQ